MSRVNTSWCRGFQLKPSDNPTSNLKFGFNPFSLDVFGFYSSLNTCDFAKFVHTLLYPQLLWPSLHYVSLLGFPSCQFCFRLLWVPVSHFLYYSYLISDLIPLSTWEGSRNIRAWDLIANCVSAGTRHCHQMTWHVWVQFIDYRIPPLDLYLFDMTRRERVMSVLDFVVRYLSWRCFRY